MVMFMPSQSHSGGVIVKPYTGNIAHKLQFLTGGKKKKQPHFKTGSPMATQILGLRCPSSNTIKSHDIKTVVELFCEGISKEN